MGLTAGSAAAVLTSASASVSASGVGGGTSGSGSDVVVVGASSSSPPPSALSGLSFPNLPTLSHLPNLSNLGGNLPNLSNLGTNLPNLGNLGKDFTTNLGSLSNGANVKEVANELLDAADKHVPTLSVNARRKYFHALAVVMFLPGVAIDVSGQLS